MKRFVVVHYWEYPIDDEMQTAMNGIPLERILLTPYSYLKTREEKKAEEENPETKGRGLNDL